jgi:hypothetical protein
MIHYYINPKTRDLYVFDPTEQSLIILERLENVCMSVGNDLADAPKDSYLDDDETPPTSVQKKISMSCSLCGTIGHNRRKCTQSPA